MEAQINADISSIDVEKKGVSCYWNVKRVAVAACRR